MDVYQNSEHKDIKHICNICGKQTLTKEILKHHQDAVHEGKMFKLTEYHQKAQTKSHLSQHKRAVHNRVKYPCMQCDHKAISKGNLG